MSSAIAIATLIATRGLGQSNLAPHASLRHESSMGCPTGSYTLTNSASGPHSRHERL